MAKGVSFPLFAAADYSYIVTCKSENPARIADNVRIFDFSLDDQQMEKLGSLDIEYRVTPSSVAEWEQRKRYYLDMP
jgi:diketogulonate reductase-like aldo/keto reductase